MINKKVLMCPHCKSKEIIKYGKRKTKKGCIQRYFCRACNRYFSESTTLLKIKIKEKIRANAVTLYSQGFSLRKISEKIKNEFKQDISHVTILKWIKKHKQEIKF